MRPIDANALKSIIMKQVKECKIKVFDPSVNLILQDIENAPTIEAAPVVRCKDCKYRQDDDFCGGRGWPAQLVPDDGYCDRGARMDGDSE